MGDGKWREYKEGGRDGGRGDYREEGIRIGSCRREEEQRSVRISYKLYPVTIQHLIGWTSLYRTQRDAALC